MTRRGSVQGSLAAVEAGGVGAGNRPAGVPEGEDDDEGDESGDWEDKDAALGTGETAGQEGAALRMGGEQMEGNHVAGVCDTEDKRLGPVPGGVEADGPPERAGSPEGEAEDEADEAGGDEAKGTFADVVFVAEAEDEGEEGGGDPEADGAGVGGPVAARRAPAMPRAMVN